MKTSKIYLTVVLALFGLTSVFGETNTEKFKVYGNCGMCESRIEKAANGVDGISSADWDKTTKEIVVTFDDSKTTLMDIHKAIADVGHDTEMVKADDKAYNSLPACCQYDRNSEEGSEHNHHNH